MAGLSLNLSCIAWTRRNAAKSELTTPSDSTRYCSVVAGHSFTYGIWEHRIFASSANFRRIRFVSLQLRLDAINFRISRSKVETPCLCGVWSWAYRMVWRRWIWILALVLSSSVPMLATACKPIWSWTLLEVTSDCVNYCFWHDVYVIFFKEFWVNTLVFYRFWSIKWALQFLKFG